MDEQVQVGDRVLMHYEGFNAPDPIGTPVKLAGVVVGFRDDIPAHVVADRIVQVESDGSVSHGRAEYNVNGVHCPFYPAGRVFTSWEHHLERI